MELGDDLPVHFAAVRAFRRWTGENTTGKRRPRDRSDAEVLDKRLISCWLIYSKDSEP